MTVSEAFYHHTKRCGSCASSLAAHWSKHPSFILSTRMFEPTCVELRATLCETGKLMLDAVTSRMPATA